MVRIILASFVGLLASAAYAEEIPLKSIWAWEMPGTKNILELESELINESKKLPDDERRELLKKSLITKFQKSLTSLKYDESAKEGFAASGSGLDALRNAIKRKDEPIPAGDVSLIYFSHPFNGSIYIYKVTREGNRIEIRCNAKPRETLDAVSKFAIVPLGQLPKGEYEVDIVCLPDPKLDYCSSVCKPFSFTVEQEEP